MEIRNTVRRRKLSVAKAPNSRQEEKKNKPVYKGFSVCKYLLIFFAIILGNFGFIVYKVSYHPSKINATVYHVSPSPKFEGPLEPNDKLSKAENLFSDELIGPESILFYNDALYTGTLDGKILELKDGKIRTIKASRFTICGSYNTEPICGRPLGIRLLDNETLIYADSYLGLFKMDIKSGKSVQLVEGGQIINGEPLSFFNDLVVLNNGTVIFTDSSSKYQRRDFMLNLMAHSNDGRILSYDLTSGALKVVRDKLYFPNGIEKSPDESFILFSETTEARITKLYLNGPKAGKTELFASELPGYPDNIRQAYHGGFWIGFACAREQGRFNLVEFMSGLPSIREFITKLVPNEYLTIFGYRLTPKYGLVVQFDANGKILQSFHDPSAKMVQDVSQVTDDGQNLYLGSFHSSYIVKFKYK